MGFGAILLEYGWQICLLAFIGCILVGIIKTPINNAVTRKLDAKNADEETRKKYNKTYDSLVYLGNYVIAFIITVIDQFIFTLNLTIGEIFEMSIQTWVLQNTFYGIWKKLGLKGLLEILMKALKNWLVKFFDKDGNGQVELHEVIEAAPEVTTDGKIDTNKLFNKASQATTGVLLNALDEVGNAAPEEIKTDTEAAKNELKSRVIDLTEITKDKLKF